MWKAIFAVAVLSTLAFGEGAGGTHGGAQPAQPVTVTQPQPDQASLLVKLNACLNQRPGTGGQLDEAMRKALSGIK